VFQNKGLIILFLLLFIIPTAIGCYFLGNIEQEQLNTFLKQLGIWTPLIYIIVYILVTILVFTHNSTQSKRRSYFWDLVGYFVDKFSCDYCRYYRFFV